MLSCYIIDDELHAIKSLTAYIEKTPGLNLIGYHQNPLSALASFREKNEYADITFIDIDMPQLSGIELSALVKDKTAVVFTTADPAFALEAFELGIRDYLLKPFSFQRFLKCIEKLNDQIASLKSQLAASEEFFYIQTENKGKLQKIATKDILFIESQKNYISIVAGDKKFLTYLTLAEVKDKLPQTFFRISKSYIINTDKITSIQGLEVFMDGTVQTFSIGTSYKEDFMKYMKNHILKTKRSTGE
jgi:DNA-binding LytR/AlgR family response regulator